MSQKPLVSVVTVVFNDLAHILQTMDSVTTQSYENLEYILIDGASSDGTKEAIVEYIKACANITLEEANGEEASEAKINTTRKQSSKAAVSLGNVVGYQTESEGADLASVTEASNEDSHKNAKETRPQARFYLEATHKVKNLTFKFLSERDSGIYDAMNKGIDLATGEWCNFMNCGDRFYASNTIEELFKQFFAAMSAQNALDSQLGNEGGAELNSSFNLAALIIYGDTQICYDSTHSKILYAKSTNHKYHHHFIHQSAFIATALLRLYHYDTSFKIAGDTDFFTKCYNSGVRFIHIPLIVSSFNVAGISSALSWQMFKEDCAIGYKYNRLFPLIHTLKYLFYVIPRVCIRNAIPKRFQNKARILFGKKST